MGHITCAFKNFQNYFKRSSNTPIPSDLIQNLSGVFGIQQVCNGEPAGQWKMNITTYLGVTFLMPPSSMRNQPVSDNLGPPPSHPCRWP